MPRITSDIKLQREQNERARARKEKDRVEAAADKLFAAVADGTIDKKPGLFKDLSNRAPARKGRR